MCCHVQALVAGEAAQGLDKLSPVDNDKFLVSESATTNLGEQFRPPRVFACHRFCYHGSLPMVYTEQSINSYMGYASSLIIVGYGAAMPRPPFAPTQ